MRDQTSEAEGDTVAGVDTQIHAVLEAEADMDM